MNLIRIATRSSPLALWQARYVAARLEAETPDCRCELVPLTTKGDRWLEGRLSSLGGKGLFVKELEAALLEDRADLAVHSLKDVPMELPPGLALPCFLSRHAPGDALVGASSLEALPQGAVVGTASQRRSMLLRHRRPDLQTKLLRGNIQTRMAKLDAGDYDAIVLAVSGLERMEHAERIGQRLPVEWMIPAPGQGTLAIEIRADDAALAARLEALNDPEAARVSAAERALSRALGGSCALPLAGYCVATAGGGLTMRAALGYPDGREVVEAAASQAAGAEPEALGMRLADSLRAQGGAAILAALASD